MTDAEWYVRFVWGNRRNYLCFIGGLREEKRKWEKIHAKKDFWCSIVRFSILTGSIDSSKSLNRYAYVEGNPISYLDPFGMQKSMLDEAHEFIGKLIGILTAINIGIIVGGVAFTAFGFVGALPVAADFVFTINKVIDILTIMDTIILAFDMIKNRHNAEKCFRDLKNIGGNLLGIAVGNKLFPYGTEKEACMRSISLQSLKAAYNGLCYIYASLLDACT